MLEKLKKEVLEANLALVDPELTCSVPAERVHFLIMISLMSSSSIKSVGRRQYGM